MHDICRQCGALLASSVVECGFCHRPLATADIISAGTQPPERIETSWWDDGIDATVFSFAVLIGRGLLILFGIGCFAGCVYLVTKFVKWAWFN
jgi:hypothetical protein